MWQAVVISLILILFMVGPGVCVGLATVTEVTATVDKIIIDKGTMYYAVTLNNGQKEVFSNEDSSAPIKCNSNDINMYLEVGKTYTFKVNFFRYQPLSCYRNILSYEECHTVK